MEPRQQCTAWLTPELRQQAERAAAKDASSLSGWLREAANSFMDRIEDRRYHPLLDPVYSGHDETESTSLATTAPLATVKQWRQLADRLGWSLSQFLATAVLLQLQRTHFEEALQEGDTTD